MIAYYAHDQGSGHCNYAQLLEDQFGKEMVTFTSSDFPFKSKDYVIYIPNENAEDTTLNQELFKTPSSLHHSPVGSKKIGIRNYTMLREMIHHNVKLMVVDVSVEVAALARSCSIPYAYVRMFGERNDLPHRLAYEGAAFLLAYYPEELEQEETPLWVREKTLYLGFFSKFKSLSSGQKKSQHLSLDSSTYHISYLKGFGGKESETHDLELWLEEFPVHHIIAIGNFENRLEHPRLSYTGVIDDISPYVQRSEFTIAACGSNLVSEMACLQARLVAVPEERPFNEQKSLANQLEQKGLCAIYDGNPIETVKNLARSGQVWENYVNYSAAEDLYSWMSAHKFDVEAMRKDLNLERNIKKLVTNGESVRADAV